MAILNFLPKAFHIVEKPQGTHAFDPIELQNPPIALIELADEPVPFDEKEALGAEKTTIKGLDQKDSKAKK
jgi:hypothetical protein